MWRSLASLLTLLWISTACSSEPDAPRVEEDIESIQAVPFPSTAVLSEESAALVESVTPDGRVRFRSVPPELADAQKGTVFVAGISEATPHGLLRVILSAATAGDALVLETLPAMPQLAYKSLHVRSRRSNVEFGADDFNLSPSLSPLQDGTLSQQKNALGKRIPIDVLIFDGDGNRDTKDDQVRLFGGIEGHIDFDVELDFDWGAIDDLPGAISDCLASLTGILTLQLPACTPLELLPELKARFDATPRGVLDVAVEGAAALSYEDDLSLGSIPLGIIAFGPVIARPSLEIRAGLLGRASARFSTGLDAELAISTGVTASSKDAIMLRPPKVSKFEVKEKPTELALFAQGKAHIGVRLNVTLWELVGPYAEVRGYGELSADSTRDPCYALVAGLEGLFGLKVSTPELPVVGALTFFDLESPPIQFFESEIASGRCTFPEDARMRGEGPDSVTLANPTSPRWQSVLAEDYESPLAAGAPAPATLGRVELLRSIDGRMIAMATGSKTLVKFDDSGSVLWKRDLPERAFDVASGKSWTFRVLSRAYDGSHFTLTELGQLGGVGRTLAYRLPPTFECFGLEPRRVHGLSNGDFAVLLSCSNGPAVVVQVAPDGRVRHAVTVSREGSNVDLSALLAQSGDLLVSGQLRPGTISGDLLVARFDDALSLRWAKRYADCNETRGFVPSQIKATYERDELVVVGGTGVGGGFFVRITPDGDVALASFPWLGVAASLHFLATDVAELPQTGYLLTGGGVDLLGGGQGAVRLMHLDGAGRPTSSTMYASPTGHTAYPGILLGDDGGFVMAAVEQETGSNSVGRLFALAGHAKDGSTDGTLLDVGGEAPRGEAECPLAAAPVMLEVTKIPLEWALVE